MNISCNRGGRKHWLTGYDDFPSTSHHRNRLMPPKWKSLNLKLLSNPGAEEIAVHEGSPTIHSFKPGKQLGSPLSFHGIISDFMERLVMYLHANTLAVLLVGNDASN